MRTFARQLAVEDFEQTMNTLRLTVNCPALAAEYNALMRRLGIEDDEAAGECCTVKCPAWLHTIFGGTRV